MADSLVNLGLQDGIQYVHVNILPALVLVARDVAHIVVIAVTCVSFAWSLARTVSILGAAWVFARAAAAVAAERFVWSRVVDPLVYDKAREYVDIGKRRRLFEAVGANNGGSLFSPPSRGVSAGRTPSRNDARQPPSPPRPPRPLPSPEHRHPPLARPRGSRSSPTTPTSRREGDFSPALASPRACAPRRPPAVDEAFPSARSATARACASNSEVASAASETVGRMVFCACIRTRRTRRRARSARCIGAGTRSRRRAAPPSPRCAAARRLCSAPRTTAKPPTREKTKRRDGS